MNTDDMLDRVCRAVDVLIDAGQRYGGLFPSLIDCGTHAMLEALPPAIEGQRDGDRAHRGSNLIHDEATLMTMYALDRPGYAEAADRYLHRFATHCTDTESGLFPWGEHAYWHLVEDRPGNSYQARDPSRKADLTHDHLRAIPLWMWQKLYDINPSCVSRFSEGLDHHWVDIEPVEYIRHAYIDRKVRHPVGNRSCDFPRHSGFYIFDWAFAYTKTGRPDFLQQIETMLDYWWAKRLPDGLCYTESRTPPNDMFDGVRGVGQTLSLATSLLETADLMEDTQPQMAAEMRRRSAVYTDGFFAAPHDPDKGLFINGWNTETGIITPMTIWGSVYGKWPASYTALMCLCHYRISGDRRLLDLAQAVGRCYMRNPFPSDVAVPTMDAGMGLGLLADLYDITGDRTWLEHGLSRAEALIPTYFGNNSLPCAAPGVDWYESQTGPGFLLHGLARLALLDGAGKDCPLKADYTGR